MSTLPKDEDPKNPQSESTGEKKTLTIELGSFAQIFGVFAGALVGRMKSKMEARSEWCKTVRADEITEDFIKDPDIFLKEVPEQFKYNGDFHKEISTAYSIRDVILEEKQSDNHDEGYIDRMASLHDALKNALYSVIRVVDPLVQPPLPPLLPSLGLGKKDESGPECKLQ